VTWLFGKVCSYPNDEPGHSGALERQCEYYQNGCYSQLPYERHRSRSLLPDVSDAGRCGSLQEPILHGGNQMCDSLFSSLRHSGNEPRQGVLVQFNGFRRDVPPHHFACFQIQQLCR
jgi:hypothetical protein